MGFADKKFSRSSGRSQNLSQENLALPDTRKSFIGFALLIFFLIFLFSIPHKHSLAYIKYVQIAGVSVKVDLALTPSEQEQGLSGRAGLDDNTGMLFVFDKP